MSLTLCNTFLNKSDAFSRWFFNKSEKLLTSSLILIQCYKLSQLTTSSATVSSSRYMQIAPEDPEEGGNRPLYVNAKQYHRILKRRQARAKLEQTGKVVRKRKVKVKVVWLTPPKCWSNTVVASVSAFFF